jgi:hypothetical protein
MPTAIEYSTLLQIIVLLSNPQLTDEQRRQFLDLLAENGFYYGDGGIGLAGSAGLQVIVSEDQYNLEMSGSLSIRGSANVSVVYNDRVCPEANRSTLGCKIAYPNKHRTCFQAGYFTAQKRNVIPLSFGSTGAYLPAITACQQYLYLPSQTRQDVRKGAYTPSR